MMSDTNKLITAMVAVGLFLGVVLMITVATNFNQATPLLSECGVNTEC